MDRHETKSGAEFITPTHLRHVMRYVRASGVIGDEDHVLDAACGVGYGTSILAEHASFAVGVDLNDEALSYARTHYAKDNIIFLKGDLLCPLDQQFEGCLKHADVIVSIETIEHFARPDIDLYLDSLMGVLKPGGKFVVSTPFCKKSGPSPVTPQHLYEFNLDDLVELLYSRSLTIDAVNLQHSPGEAGRLGYAMVVCHS